MRWCAPAPFWGLPCGDEGCWPPLALCPFGGVVEAGVGLTLLPSFSLSCPSTTPTSPPFNPALGPTLSAVACAIVPVCVLTVFLPWTPHTVVPAGPCCVAARDRTTRCMSRYAR